MVKNNLAEKQTTELSTPQAYENMGQDIGVENMATPRLKLLQGISPEVDEDKPGYVEGAKKGDIYNTVTGDLAKSIYVIPLKFTSGYVAFDKTERMPYYSKQAETNLFATAPEAVSELIAEGHQPDNFKITKSHRHILIEVKRAEGSDDWKMVSPAISDWTNSKVKVGERWNSAIHAKGGPRFDCIWKLSSKTESYAGNQYYNFAYKYIGQTPKELLEECADLYNKIN